MSRQTQNTPHSGQPWAGDEEARASDEESWVGDEENEETDQNVCLDEVNIVVINLFWPSVAIIILAVGAALYF